MNGADSSFPGHGLRFIDQLSASSVTRRPRYDISKAVVFVCRSAFQKNAFLSSSLPLYLTIPRQYLLLIRRISPRFRSSFLEISLSISFYKTLAFHNLFSLKPASKTPETEKKDTSFSNCSKLKDSTNEKMENQQSLWHNTPRMVENQQSFWQFSDQLRLQTTHFSNLSINDSIWATSKRPEERRNFDSRVGGKVASKQKGSDLNAFNDGWKMSGITGVGSNPQKNVNGVGPKDFFNDGWKMGVISSVSNPQKTSKEISKKKKNSSNNNDENKGSGNSNSNNNAVDKRFKTLPPGEALPRNETVGGYIFVCNNDTMAENLRRQLFGLPPRYRDSVRAITPGLPLFLYNYSTHQLHGIFEAASFGGSNIDPTAWEDKKCPGESRFPAQAILGSIEFWVFGISGIIPTINHVARTSITSQRDVVAQLMDEVHVTQTVHAKLVVKFVAICFMAFGYDVVRVVTRKNCEPLVEDSFRPVLYHYDGPKFRLELSVPEALALLDIFAENNK
ncbi:hypothetical protein ACLOJK_009859 [Asimina triloba]